MPVYENTGETGVAHIVVNEPSFQHLRMFILSNANNIMRTAADSIALLLDDAQKVLRREKELPYKLPLEGLKAEIKKFSESSEQIYFATNSVWSIAERTSMDADVTPMDTLTDHYNNVRDAAAATSAFMFSIETIHDLFEGIPDGERDAKADFLDARFKSMSIALQSLSQAQERLNIATEALHKAHADGN